MVINRKQHSAETRVKQASNEIHSNLNKIGASTPYDFCAWNLTPYGGLLPVATMLEKIGFEKLINETVTVETTTKAMSTCQFILAIVLGDIAIKIAADGDRTSMFPFIRFTNGGERMNVLKPSWLTFSLKSACACCAIKKGFNSRRGAPVLRGILEGVWTASPGNPESSLSPPAD
jgi:hypothetical protein